MMATAKTVARFVVPKFIRDWRWQKIKERREAEIAELPLPKKFDHIYREGLWGRTTNGEMSSGHGTRDAAIVEPYLAAVSEFLEQQPRPLCLVDIGCGDFEVGKRLLPNVDHYVACDISKKIIEQNIRVHGGKPKLQFRVLNAVEESLPDGDIVTLRQVLQHLSNAEIASILPKLSAYRHIIVTEGLPDGPFRPNADHKAGFSVRPIENKSGVDLAKPPFNLAHKQARVLCEVPNTGGVGLIRTTLYSS